MSPGDRSTRGANRVVRGGSWINNGRNVRSAYRNHNTPDNRNNNLGFRLARAQRTVGMGANDQIVIRSVRGTASIVSSSANTRVRGAEVAGWMPRETPPRDRLYGDPCSGDCIRIAKGCMIRGLANRINCARVGACLQANPCLCVAEIPFACKHAPTKKSSLTFQRSLRSRVNAERLHA